MIVPREEFARLDFCAFFLTFLPRLRLSFFVTFRFVWELSMHVDLSVLLAVVRRCSVFPFQWISIALHHDAGFESLVVEELCATLVVCAELGALRLGLGGFPHLLQKICFNQKKTKI